MASRTLSYSGFTGSILAFLSALCCILPMGLMLTGLSGVWVATFGGMAIFGDIAAVSPYVIGISFLFLIFAWFMQSKQQASRATSVLLASCTALTIVALGIYIFERDLNDLIIGYM